MHTTDHEFSVTKHGSRRPFASPFLSPSSPRRTSSCDLKKCPSQHHAFPKVQLTRRLSARRMTGKFFNRDGQRKSLSPITRPSSRLFSHHSERPLLVGMGVRGLVSTYVQRSCFPCRFRATDSIMKMYWNRQLPCCLLSSAAQVARAALPDSASFIQCGVEAGVLLLLSSAATQQLSDSLSVLELAIGSRCL